MSGAEIDRRTLIGGGIAAARSPRPASPARSRRAARRRSPAPPARFIGERSGGGVMNFRGIRYGRAERFRARYPEPRATAPVRAVQWGPSSPQAGKGYTGDAAGIPANEDCLVLNIWTTGKTDKPKPVMFYIHGGAYSSGTGSSALYDGTQLAERDMVVVTINHRLNAFGYLYLARLDPRFADSGNAGQLDLILALKWVRDNIARVRRRSGARDGIRPVGRRREDRDDDRHARRQGPVQPRDHDERAASHRVGSAQRHDAREGVSRQARQSRVRPVARDADRETGRRPVGDPIRSWAAGSIWGRCST